MKIAVSLAVALVTVLLTFAPSASAQDAPSLVVPAAEGVSLTTQAERDALRASIQTEADWSIALYVASPLTFVAGSTLAFVGFARSLAWDASALAQGDAMMAVGVGLGVLGILTLPVAIGLHVDSDSRRGALSSEVALSIGPSSVSATFRF